MQLIPCPWCGPREEVEFHYGGQAHVAYPEEPAALTDEGFRCVSGGTDSHLMLVDLARNDVGRVSDFGSVKVPDFMTVESYSSVHHLVSRVTGRLRKDQTPLDAFKSIFPAGTVFKGFFVSASITVKSLEPTLATYATLKSGLKVTLCGLLPADTSAMTFRDSPSRI